MVRRVLIATLTFATVGTGVVWAISFRAPPHRLDTLTQYHPLFEMSDYTLYTGTLRGRLMIVYKCPYPFRMNAEPVTTVVEWIESLEASPRIPQCRVCRQPEISHAPHCFMKGVIIDVFNPSEQRDLSYGVLSWRTRVSRGWRTSECDVPLWLPFALLAAYPVIAFVRGPLRRYRRRKRNQCAHCGYNLTGLPEPRCPECGNPV